MVRPGARRTAVFLVSAVLASVFAVPLVGAGATEIPPAACPSQGGTQQHMAESLTVTVTVDGVGVGGLWGNVSPGSTVGVSVVVPAGCPSVTLTLASYNSPIAGFSVDQWLSDSDTQTVAGTGARTSFSVEVPDCYFQVDFAYGGVITDFRQGMYGPRLIGSDVGGGRTCERLPPPQPVPSPSPSAPESPVPTPSVPETVTPSPSPSTPGNPSPTPSETATPTPTPSETATPTPTPSETVTPTPTPSETVTSTPTTPGTVVPPPSSTVPAPPPSSGVLGVTTTRPTPTPSPSPSLGVLGVSTAAPTSAPAATVRVAGDSRVARLADTGIPGSLLAFVALLFGTAGGLLLVGARVRTVQARDDD